MRFVTTYGAELTMAGVAGDHFMAPASRRFLTEQVTDLPDSHQETGVTFSLTPGACPRAKSNAHN